MALKDSLSFQITTHDALPPHYYRGICSPLGWRTETVYLCIAVVLAVLASIHQDQALRPWAASTWLGLGPETPLAISTWLELGSREVSCQPCMSESGPRAPCCLCPAGIRVQPCATPTQPESGSGGPALLLPSWKQALGPHATSAWPLHARM